MTTTGLLLAAGAGARMGVPKALVTDEVRGPWLTSSILALRDGGCEDVVVVLGAAADEGRRLVGESARVVVADGWAGGMAVSLAAGLRVAEDTGAESAVVHLVDLPDVGHDVVARVLAHAGTEVLARAVYSGGPGHPVLIGRTHWSGVAAAATGDGGARDYLADRTVLEVECGDLATGGDVDVPRPGLGRWHPPR
ncbi:hypothetical protein HMPREF0063_11727 [Aeromicrobium marinum DSM 15272]|uniref:MobA-like NTP transferase domain-containing protein n=1 Tax=Aeromicrobium marinum DSM 15272 TaxID=585531 RepID=E2SDE1_9ACTN|nr:NTP transferase domain-containing protein [Aeromicrobium marinum]EFQ82518.1 hypothetical protein HMPREF0063_11727 [Aeromicrobium marinum DSM 15272]